MWKAACAAVLLLTLHMISDDSFSVFAALNRHEDKLRITLASQSHSLGDSTVAVRVVITVSVSVLGTCSFSPLLSPQRILL
jgi:hypothetical protein